MNFHKITFYVYLKEKIAGKQSFITSKEQETYIVFPFDIRNRFRLCLSSVLCLQGQNYRGVPFCEKHFKI